MRVFRSVMVGAIIAVVSLISGNTGAVAAPYAAYVMDARNGETLYSRDAERRLHPASLTKMMTLYLAFEAVRDGRLSLGQNVRVSRHAAGQVPSKIGLRPGQRVTIRDLIRATAVKSANDAAVALGEAISGSERAFAKKMTSRAHQIGMRNTTFRNASGLTASGQLSTAKDMAVLGRALFMDFPEYYNLFGRKQTNAVGRTIRSTNRRFLGSYEGADGIKTGYTSAAGFNLVSSAKRGDKRVIAVVFGGRSSSQRNAKVAELLDLGFKRAPANARIVRRQPTRQAINVNESPLPDPRPGTSASAASLFAQVGNAITPSAHASTSPQRVASSFSPETSPLPLRRPGSATASANKRAPAIAVVSPEPRPEEAAPETTGNSITAPTPRPRKASIAKAPAGDWAVQLGVFANEESAIAELTSVALSDVSGLNSAGREITETRLSGESVFRARLTGFDKATAAAACNALKSRGKPCLTVAASRS